MDNTTLQHLLKIKKYELPPEEYFDSFLEEFHYRQRAELLNLSVTDMILTVFRDIFFLRISPKISFVFLLTLFLGAIYILAGYHPDVNKVSSLASSSRFTLGDFSPSMVHSKGLNDSPFFVDHESIGVKNPNLSQSQESMSELSIYGYDSKLEELLGSFRGYPDSFKVKSRGDLYPQEEVKSFSF